MGKTAAGKTIDKKTATGKVILKITGLLLRVLLNIVFYVAVVILLIQAGKFTYEFAYQVFGSVSMEAEPGRDVEFQILQGESTMNIAGRLETSLVIKDKYSFYMRVKLKKSDIMPGTFVLNTSMDYEQILDEITDLNNSIEEVDEEIDNTSKDSDVNNKDTKKSP